jgi:hypothetical protein
VAAETVAGKAADALVMLVSHSLHHPSLRPLPAITHPFSLPRSAVVTGPREMPGEETARTRRRGSLQEEEHAPGRALHYPRSPPTRPASADSSSSPVSPSRPCFFSRPSAARA